jgi:hypothetical protein
MQQTTKSFPLALRELVVEHDYVTRSGAPNWAAFAAQVDGFHYETVRRVATGRRVPVPRLIEECARALRVRPEYFLEYRVFQAQRDFDPSVVGLEKALQNLEAWAQVSTGGAPRSDNESVRS